MVDAWWNNRGVFFFSRFSMRFRKNGDDELGRMTSRFVKPPYHTANELFNQLSGRRNTPEHKELADTFAS